MGIFNDKETLRYDASELERELLRPGEGNLKDIAPTPPRHGAGAHEAPPRGEPAGSWIPTLAELRTLGPKPVIEVVRIVHDRRKRAGKITAEEAKRAQERLAGLQQKEFWQVVLAESLYGFAGLCAAVTLGVGVLAGPLVGIGAGAWLLCYPFLAGSAKDED